MKIMITMDSAGPEGSAADTAKALAARFGVLVFDTGRTSPAGWELRIIGTPAQIVNMLTTDDGGWGTGNAEEDAEVLFYAMREATEVHG